MQAVSVFERLTHVGPDITMRGQAVDENHIRSFTLRDDADAVGSEISIACLRPTTQGYPSKGHEYDESWSEKQ